MARRFVSMDTMTMLPMLVRHTATTVRNGLMAESLLARARGTAMAITAEAITDAGFMAEAVTAAEATDVKVTRVAAIAAATTEVVMREATPAEEVASMAAAVVGSTVAAEVSTVAGEGPTAVGTDKLIRSPQVLPRLAALRCQLFLLGNSLSLRGARI
jgi:hypothetical protein